MKNALGSILLGSLPTFLLVILLHFYLKAVFFKPLERVLAERRAATQGAREAAEQSLTRAEQRAQEYENALRAARNEVYKEQEEQRRKWRDEQAAQVLEARKQADATVAQSRQQLDAETQQAKASLEADSRTLADEITRHILQGAAR